MCISTNGAAGSWAEEKKIEFTTVLLRRKNSFQHTTGCEFTMPCAEASMQKGSGMNIMSSATAC